MYALFAKSKTAVALEKEVTKLGYKYTGDVVDHSYSAYTDTEAKEIRINKNKTPQEAALSYAYELQNAKNGPNYNAIFDDARAGRISDRSEFAKRIMNYEAEAIENRAKIAIELGLESTQPTDVVAAVKNVADPAERKRRILQWADSKGKIQGTSPSDHYMKMFDDNFAKHK